MPLTKELIQTVTVGAGGAASIDFTSIPQTFDDIYVVFSMRTSFASPYQQINITLNGSSSTFTQRNLSGSGASVSSNTNPYPDGGATGANATTNTFSSGTIYFPNYRSSINKSYSSDTVTENNAAAASASIGAGLWSNTAAITSLGINGVGQTLVQYSTASLYGILKGSNNGVTVA